MRSVSIYKNMYFFLLSFYFLCLSSPLEQYFDFLLRGVFSGMKMNQIGTLGGSLTVDTLVINLKKFY